MQQFFLLLRFLQKQYWPCRQSFVITMNTLGRMPLFGLVTLFMITLLTMFLFIIVALTAFTILFRYATVISSWLELSSTNISFFSFLSLFYIVLLYLPVFQCGCVSLSSTKIKNFTVDEHNWLMSLILPSIWFIISLNYTYDSI